MKNKEAHALAVLVFNDEVVSVLLQNDTMALDQMLDALVEVSQTDHHLHDRMFSLRRQIAEKRGYTCRSCSGWDGTAYNPNYRQFGEKTFCRGCWLDFEVEMR